MYKAPAFCIVFSCLWFILAILSSTTFATTRNAKQGCNTTCGNLTVPYPFGIGLDGSCSFNTFYMISCNITSNGSPKPFLGRGNLEIVDISITGQMRVKNFVASKQFLKGKIVRSNSANIELYRYPFVYSDTENKLTLIGCDDYVYIYGTLGQTFRSGCIAGCSELQDILNGSCSGIGCCQTSIPKGLKIFEIKVSSFSNHTNVSYFNPYSYAFLADQDRFSFNVTDLYDPDFMNRTTEHVPVVLEWFMGANQSCYEAEGNQFSYGCQDNTNCTDFDAVSTRGYRCNCLAGYEGNPYLSPGCTDINECASNTSNLCSHICTNIPGSYYCSCPKGRRGDGLRNGTSCIGNPSQFVMKLSLGLSLGFVSSLMLLSWICFTIVKRKKLVRTRERYFEQNGGKLLEQLLLQKGRTVESCKQFSADELKAATNNYSEDRILGKGGYGTVYKGILQDGCEVAIKKSKVVDQTQVEQFINEVVILTQINHRNVVKLLGCCLETEVPLLVYEFISNDTLFKHIHRNKGITSWLTWANIIRVSSEAADALMYLHSSATIPIIHRDVKSANILLDESYTTKIADFGASRLVPIDQTQVSTLVQGTIGYLDPEYFQTSQLTEKSDVYSFGVVLAELLTKEKPLCLDRKMEDRNLATYFVSGLKQDRLMKILDPQLVREASEGQLVQMGKLVKECLNLKGEDRPTMKEVALELEGFKKQNRHPWSELNNEETSNFIRQQDLYPVPSSSIEHSGQYSMEMSLIADMNHPR